MLLDGFFLCCCARSLPDVSCRSNRILIPSHLSAERRAYSALALGLEPYLNMECV
ncbi:hypothetical protein ACNKHW_12660 [Shigella flexneri]